MATDEQQHTGAMIALIPSLADIARFAVEGGEPADELHLTLAYLGEADEIAPDERDELITWAREYAAQWSAVEGRVFGGAVLNGDGGAEGDAQPCLVLLVTGGEVAEVHETAMGDALAIANNLPSQYEPWLAHITLQYGELGEGVPTDLGDLPVGVLGPVTFDRLRLAFGGEVTDVPFGAAEMAEAEPVEDGGDELPGPAEGIVTETEARVAAGFPVERAPEREPWTGCLRGLHPAHSGPCPPAL